MQQSRLHSRDGERISLRPLKRVQGSECPEGVDHAGIQAHAIDRGIAHQFDECRHDIATAIGPARGPLDELPLGSLPPEHVVVSQRCDELLWSCLGERRPARAGRLLMHHPPDPSVRLVAERGDIGPAGAGLEAGGRGIVLHDVVVPVDHPDLAVRAHLRGNRCGPFVSAGDEVPRHPAGKGGADRGEPERGHNVAGRFADKRRAVPILPRIRPGRIEPVAGRGGEAAVMIHLADRHELAAARGQFHHG